jgi:hypothetical protein
MRNRCDSRRAEVPLAPSLGAKAPHRCGVHSDTYADIQNCVVESRTCRLTRTLDKRAQARTTHVICVHHWTFDSLANASLVGRGTERQRSTLPYTRPPFGISQPFSRRPHPGPLCVTTSLCIDPDGLGIEETLQRFCPRFFAPTTRFVTAKRYAGIEHVVCVDPHRASL